MDARKALDAGTVLVFENSPVHYIIRNELGRGASCIVYNAVYRNNAGDETAVRIKEYYPYDLPFTRLPDGSRSDSAPFREGLAEFEASFRALNAIHERSNTAAIPINIYSANHTRYIVTALTHGKILTSARLRSLRECAEIVKAAAKAIRILHENDLLYLDIKPDNIFLLDETTDFVQLFDFDSVVSLSDLKNGTLRRISFTKGFAAPELTQERIEQLSKASDVYGIGALFYFLLFGKTPSAAERDFDAFDTGFDYGQMRFDPAGYRDTFFAALTRFFRNTLSGYIPDRYEDMDAVISALSEIISLADRSSPYILSTKVNHPDLFIGRNEELEILKDWFSENGSNCLLISGMGGIGKSTLAKAFIAANRSGFDAVIWMNQRDTLAETFADDTQFVLNTAFRTKEESAAEYFRRKLCCCRRLPDLSKTLVVIDNFTLFADEALEKILSLGWKVLLLSRMDVPIRGSLSVRLGGFERLNEVRTLFETISRRELSESDLPALGSFIKRIGGNTLLLELLAIHREIYGTSISEMIERAFSQTGGMFREELELYGTPFTIEKGIRSLLEADKLPTGLKDILLFLSIFGDSGFDPSLLSRPEVPRFMRSVYELRKRGWVEPSESTQITVHPLIRDAAAAVFRKREGFHQCFDTVSGSVKTRFRDLESMTEKEKKERFPEVLRLLETAEILYAESDFRDDEILYHIILNYPLDREEALISYGAHLNRMDCRLSGRAMLKASERLVDLYANREDLSAMRRQIRFTREFLKRKKNISPLTRSAWYNLISEYYNQKIAGDYVCPENPDDLQKLLSSLKNRTCFARISTHPDAPYQLAESQISRAIILSRLYQGEPELKSKIERLLSEAESLFERNHWEVSEASEGLFFAKGWYYTYVQPDPERAKAAVYQAKSIAEKVWSCDLDLIDQTLIPTANILLETGNFRESLEELRAAMDLCAKYPDFIPYERKKKDLASHCEDVYQKMSGDSL